MRRLLLLALAALSLGGAIWVDGASHRPFANAQGRSAPPSRSFAFAHDDKLVDQRGREFTLASLRGEPVVVTFVAAHCTDACPLVNAQFANAARILKRDRLHVRLLTITLDPEHDSPATMRALARRFGANPRQWILAGGSRSHVHGVMRSFGVVAQRGRKGYADVHTTFVYFLDAKGVLRNVLLASTDLSNQIALELHQQWRALAG